MLAIHQRHDWALYALFKYFWILVILPKFVQLAFLGVLLILIWFRSFREKPIDHFTVAQLFFLLIYGVAIVTNAISSHHELGRILAAVNTWLITAVALGFYHFFRQSDIDLHRAGKYCLYNLLLLVLLWCVYAFTGGAKPFPVLGHTLMGDDWVNGQYVPRFLGYMDYANLVVFCVLFFYPLAMRFLHKKKLFQFALTIMLYPVIDTTNSRTGQLLYLLLFAAYFLFEFQARFFQLYKKQKRVLLFLLCFGLAAVAIFCSGQLLRIFNSFMSMREDSNSMRGMIYSTSLQVMLEQSPFIGIGIKDMLGDYPLGSHSTYIGVFYKAGILGGLLYVISMLTITLRSLLGRDTDRQAVTLKISILAVILMMVFEDIDGANWCVCIFYILLALLQKEHHLFQNVKDLKGSNYEKPED